MTNTSNKSRISRFRSAPEAVDYFKTHQRTRGKDVQANRAQTLSWNCDGSRLVVGSNDKKICVLQVDNSCRLTHDFTATTHEGSIEQVAFQPDGPNLFASASDDKSVCLWDVRQPKKHTKLATKAPILYVTWSPCGKYLFYLGKDDKVNVMDSRSLAVLKTHEMNRESAEIVCHPEGKHLFIGTSTGKVEILSIPDLEPVHSQQAHSQQAFILALTLSPDGRRMATGGNDSLVTIWDLENMTCESAIPRMDYPVRTLGFSADSTLLATGSEDHHVDIAWAEDGQRIFELPLESEVYQIAWHPRHMVLAYTCPSSDSRVRNDDVKIFGLSG